MKRRWKPVPEVFEPLHELTLRAAHNEMSFHTWGQDECCLPRGRGSRDAARRFSRLAGGRRSDLAGSERAADRRGRGRGPYAIVTRSG